MDLLTHIFEYLQNSWRILEVILIFGLLVIGHEFGHFVMAKLAGMRVDEFAIGFGKCIFSWRKGETLYSVNLIPFGGYNRIYGMDLEEEEPVSSNDTKNDESDNSLSEQKEDKTKILNKLSPDYSIASADDPRAFVNRPLLHRFAVVVAGSLANILIAVMIIFLMGITIGFPAAELGKINPGGPAAGAGLEPGDIITRLDGVRISSTTDLFRAVAYSEGRPLHLTGLRDANEFSVTVNPQPIRIVDSHLCRLGFVYLNDGTILYPMPGTPAARAGLKAYDNILSVDGIRFPSHKLDIENGNGIAVFEVYRELSIAKVQVDYFNDEFVRDTYSSFGFFLNENRVVTSVVPNSIAADSGLEAGDHIVASSQEMWASGASSEPASAPKILEVTYERSGVRHRARMIPDESFSRIQVYMDDASYPVLANLPYDHPLYLAGLRSGYRILSVEGTPTKNGIAVFLELERWLGKTVSVVAMADGKESVFNFRLPPDTDKEGLTRFMGGLHFAIRYFRADPFTSFVTGLRKCQDIVLLSFKTIQMLVTGRASVNDLVGPVWMATTTYQAASSGLVDLVNWVALLSILVGITNLLPLPALDGGRIFFMVAEGILRRPVVNVRVENLIHIAGFLLLILLGLFVAYHDIARIITAN